MFLEPGVQNTNEINLVAPTGFEPVFAVRHALSQIGSLHVVDPTPRLPGLKFDLDFSPSMRPPRTAKQRDSPTETTARHSAGNWD